MTETVFEFLERNPNPLPSVMTVERTKVSSYLFYCLVRHYRKRIKPRPRFLAYVKAEANAVKATIEEHSLWGADGDFYVLEGFSLKFVEGLSLPPNTYVVAETDGGFLKAEPFAFRQRRNILKVLYQQLGLDYHKDESGRSILTLRGLIHQDWASFRSYEDFEPFLRKAKIMGWGDEELVKRLDSPEGGNVLTLIKRSQFQQIEAMVQRYGAGWVYAHVTELLSELLHYRALRVMGYDESKCARELGAETNYRKMRELEEAHRMYSSEDLFALTERVVGLDGLVTRNQPLGLSLLCLNAPIRVRKLG